MDERDDLHNTSAFHADTHYHPLNLIEEASAGNYLYKSYIREPIADLRCRFDLKYWPSISGCLDVLAKDAHAARVVAADPLTAAATDASRKSLADFFKALLASMDENRVDQHGFLPNDFRLTDESLASLVNCALDLGPDELVDATYVKRLRQRERQRRAASV